MKKIRKSKGQVLVEFPIALWLGFIVFALPLTALATFTYRACSVYFAVRDTCKRAARADTYTDAKAIAATTWAKDISAWTGISGTENITILAQSTGLAFDNGTQLLPTPAAVKAFMQADAYHATYAANSYSFLMVLNATTTLDPLLPCNSAWFGLSVPGLNAPFTLTTNYQTVVENRVGMKS